MSTEETVPSYLQPCVAELFKRAAEFPEADFIVLESEVPDGAVSLGSVPHPLRQQHSMALQLERGADSLEVNARGAGREAMREARREALRMGVQSLLLNQAYLYALNKEFNHMARCIEEDLEPLLCKGWMLVLVKSRPKFDILNSVVFKDPMP